MNFSHHLHQFPIFKVLSEAADSLRLEAYVVGGYTRDLILKRPNKDIDVVCVGSGIALAEEVARRLGNGVHVNVFKNFGTAQIPHESFDLEFVGARKNRTTVILENLLWKTERFQMIRTEEILR